MPPKTGGILDTLFSTRRRLTPGDVAVFFPEVKSGQLVVSIQSRGSRLLDWSSREKWCWGAPCSP